MEEDVSFHMDPKTSKRSERMTDSAKDIKDEFADFLTFSETSLKVLWDNKEDETWNKLLRPRVLT